MGTYTDNIEQYLGIHWGAVMAGATASAALAILLSVLGSGLGFAVISPWANSGISAAALGISAILWLSATQVIACGAGGFIAGRLRAKWRGVHTDEVYFTDTIHGFLTWAISLLVTATLFVSLLGSAFHQGVQSATMLAKGEAVSMTKMHGMSDAQGYYLDTLFRYEGTAKPGNAATPSQDNRWAMRQEIRRMLMKSLHDHHIAGEDIKYAGQLIAHDTGLSQEAAEKRVKDIYTALANAAASAKTAAEKARKASAYISLWGFIALLMGAFTASLAATWGGRHRDHFPGSKL